MTYLVKNNSTSTYRLFISVFLVRKQFKLMLSVYPVVELQNLASKRPKNPGINDPMPTLR